MVLKAGHRLIIALLVSTIFTILFCLPGSDLPDEGLFSKIPFFDKWVHIGIFCTTIIVWRWAMQLFTLKQLSILVLLAAVYGYLIEIIQYNFIPGRSFDWADLAADIIGSTIGCFLWARWHIYIKK